MLFWPWYSQWKPASWLVLADRTYQCVSGQLPVISYGLLLFALRSKLSALCSISSKYLGDVCYQSSHFLSPPFQQPLCTS